MRTLLAASAIAVLIQNAALAEYKASTAPHKIINERLTTAWQANNVKPSARANDYEFCRRVFLDLIGRIPTPEELRAFARPGESADRAKLVRKLLHEAPYDQEFAHHMANVWTVWLLTRSGNATYREQMQAWLEDQFEKNASYKSIVTDLITAKGKTNDNGAVNFVLGNVGEAIARGKVTDEGQFEMVPATSRTTRLFLGLQTQCVQCHDHPFNPDWKQSSFWGVNAFYRQVSRVGNPITRPIPQMQQAAILELKDNDEVNRDGIIYYERRNGMILPTGLTFVDGRKAELSAGKTRRELLADLIVTHENFPKAIVNRTWGMLFGRGLNELPVVDDFGEHNKVVHEQLLDLLAKELVYADYNLKDLFTWICTSNAYSLSSVANSTNDKPETDVFFSRMLLKSMSPEQMLESLWVATQGKPSRDSGDTKAISDRKDAWTRRLVQNFGDDEGNEVTFNGTVIQALLMMNGKEINEEIRNPSGTVVSAINRKGSNFASIRNDIFIAALSRNPIDSDVNAIRKVADRYGGKIDKTFYADVMWALLNSNEFILNH